MATFIWSGSFGFALSDLDFSYLMYGYSYTRGSTLFSVNYDSRGYSRDEFRGTGFTYDVHGIPTGGTVKSYAAFNNGVKVGFVDGLNISVSSLVSAANTYSTSDDLKILKAAFAGNDRITGGQYGDKLEGFGGNDVLYGRAGADKLFGGAGADTFVFKLTRDSTVSSGGRDTIYDFSATHNDRIDLRSIDADTKISGDQAFSFIGKTTFHKKPGELRYDVKTGGVLVYGDVNGDGNADFSIFIKGVAALSKGYFYL